jgi:hypothetical protein
VFGFFQALAAAVALMAPPGPPEPSYVGPVDRHVSPYLPVGSSVVCVPHLAENSVPSAGTWGEFPAGMPGGEMDLDGGSVCQPLRNLWRFGWPTTGAGQWYLAFAIQTVAHEAGHASQKVEGWIAPAGSGTLGREHDAQCRAAESYTRWAKRLGVTTPEERQALAQLIRQYDSYNGWKTPARCWEGRS